MKNVFKKIGGFEVNQVKANEMVKTFEKRTGVPWCWHHSGAGTIFLPYLDFKNVLGDVRFATSVFSAVTGEYQSILQVAEKSRMLLPEVMAGLKPLIAVHLVEGTVDRGGKLTHVRRKSIKGTVWTL